ncbi:hypothetical protein FANTH_5923, partial [Fusarium anthophilum]
TVTAASGCVGTINSPEVNATISGPGKADTQTAAVSEGSGDDGNSNEPIENLESNGNPALDDISNAENQVSDAKASADAQSTELSVVEWIQAEMIKSLGKIKGNLDIVAGQIEDLASNNGRNQRAAEPSDGGYGNRPRTEEDRVE